MKIKCIIFDLDGTLVDSEWICNRAFLDLIPELDDSVDQMAARYRGVELALIFQDIEKSIGRALPGTFEQEYRARVAELMAKELKPSPGVHEMLEALDVPCCIASSAPRKKIALALSVCSLSSFFGDRIFSAYDVGSWKPDPGLFLHAASAMGCEPQSCAVVEDSPPGIEAALAAEMRTFHYLPKGGGSSDSRVIAFSDMSCLPSLLKQRQSESMR